MRALLAAVALLVATTLTSCTSSGAGGGAPSLKSVATLLAGHTSAVGKHDEKAFAAALSNAKPSAAFRARQLATFGNLGKVPIESWAYRVAGPTDDRGFETTATKRYGTKAIIVRLTLSYRFTGIDAHPTSHELWWTFVQRDGRTVIAGDDDLAQGGGRSWQGPWDFGPVQVVSSAGNLVIGHPADAAVLQTAARLVTSAVPKVSAVWGTQWAQRVAVLVPSTPTELRNDVGEANAQVGEVAALAVSDSVDPLSHDVLGQRLIVYPGALRGLSETGAQIVFRHEITHIASGKATTDITPRWLVEGFADYVGILTSGQRPGQAASELRTDIRANKVPTTLPTEDQFDTSGAQAQAYEGGWLACRLIAAKAGQSGLVRFYREVGAQPTDSDAATASGLRSVLHESTAAFVAQWRQYLRTQLGH